MTNTPHRSALVLTLVFATTHAGAAPSAAKRDERSLRSAIGVGAARVLLRADATDARQRAFARLGAQGSARALELLAGALDNGAARDARERLAVVRALAPHAADPTAQDALIRALGGVEGRTEARDRLVEETAALALSASQHPLAVSALARALRQPGRVSEAAHGAFVAHPPKSLRPLLDATGGPTPALVDLLGELADRSAEPLLAELATDGSATLKAHALSALFRLDRARSLELSRAALAQATDGGVRGAAVRVLALGDAADAGPALAALLKDPATRDAALDIALETASPALGNALAAAPATGVDADRLFAALGRAGGSAALARLERELGRPENAWSAAYALAQSEDTDADDVLARALARPAQRRDALRAAVLRSVLRGRHVGGLERAVAAMATGDANERALSAWCEAVLEPQRVSTALAKGDPAIVRAIARQAFTPELAPVATRRLATERDAGLAGALSTALVVPDAANLVPTATLVELIERHGPESYLAAYALALRDSEIERPRLRELLAAEDPTLRAHTALGLGASSQPDAVGLLAAAYRSEVDARVRRAIVAALAARSERARELTLELAATLEPDTKARDLARSALHWRSTPGLAARADRGAVWLRIMPPPSGSVPIALIETPLGLALPFAADADGNLTVAGLPEGDVSVTLVVPEPSAVPRGARP